MLDAFLIHAERMDIDIFAALLAGASLLWGLLALVVGNIVVLKEEYSTLEEFSQTHMSSGPILG
jgi:hypothetical protein